jgi:hypothetical protein
LVKSIEWIEFGLGGLIGRTGEARFLIEVGHLILSFYVGMNKVFKSSSIFNRLNLPLIHLIHLVLFFFISLA